MSQAEGKCHDMQCIIVSACLVCSFVASLAIILLLHQYERELNVNRTAVSEPHAPFTHGESGSETTEF